MPKYKTFDELPAWQTAVRLYNSVLDLLETKEPKFFPASETNLNAPHFPSPTTSLKASND